MAKHWAQLLECPAMEQIQQGPQNSTWSILEWNGPELYGKYIYIRTFKYIRTGIVDYLREGLPWPAQTLKHTESNSFIHMPTTSKHTNWYSISHYLRASQSGPPSIYIFCRLRIEQPNIRSILWNKDTTKLYIPKFKCHFGSFWGWFPMVSWCFLHWPWSESPNCWSTSLPTPPRLDTWGRRPEPNAEGLGESASVIWIHTGFAGEISNS